MFKEEQPLALSLSPSFVDNHILPAPGPPARSETGRADATAEEPRAAEDRPCPAAAAYCSRRRPGRGRPAPHAAAAAAAACRSLTALVRAVAPLSSESPRLSPPPGQPPLPPLPPSTLTLSQAAGPRPPPPPPAPPPAPHLLLRLLLQQGPSCWSASSSSSSSSSSSAPSLVVLVPFLFLGLRPAPETGAETRARLLLPGAGQAEGAGRAREQSSESPATNAVEGGRRRSPPGPGAHPRPEPKNWPPQRLGVPRASGQTARVWPREEILLSCPFFPAYIPNTKRSTIFREASVFKLINSITVTANVFILFVNNISHTFLNSEQRTVLFSC
ncbi:protein enabled homolog [Bubalus bubalis]|uniref:protein enabled homolog n=1 Tax=Bubalus bubalis TaxID=89462 RepID=UPI001E1B73DE|nr:protein enabled homolog [Bubalus bubalis]